MNIEKYINIHFPKKKILKEIKEKDLEYSNWYYETAKADAIYGYSCIKKKIFKNMKILEVGGGLHFLASYLSSKGYNITSIEPGGFNNSVNIMRKNTLKNNKKNNKHIITTDVENFSKGFAKNKFEFIYSINVLEHVKNIKKHILSYLSILNLNEGLILIRCPNYSFPFEGHFYKFFIPFFPKFTFEKVLKKNLIKKYGKARYLNILNSINFNCSYRKIKQMNFNLVFKNPIEDIFNRIEIDKTFRKRIFSNNIVKYVYKLIKFLHLKKFLILIFPISINPYLIMHISK